jgi:uncharacterized protein YijF (DUF1287 family)
MDELRISNGCAGCKSAAPRLLLHRVPDLERTDANSDHRQIGRARQFFERCRERHETGRPACNPPVRSEDVLVSQQQ